MSHDPSEILQSYVDLELRKHFLLSVLKTVMLLNLVENVIHFLQILY